MPFELRPYPQETLSPKDEYIQHAWHNNIAPLAKSLGVTMNMPSIDPYPYTFYAHEGLLFAKDYGKGNEYADAVFRALYHDGQDIGSIEVLAAVAESIGLNQKAFIEVLETRKNSDRRAALVREAYTTAQVRAVPTFDIGGQVLTGLQSKQAIEEAIKEAENNH